jgi:hypothetical protein
MRFVLAISIFEFRVNEGSEEREHLKDLEVGGRMILKLILKEFNERVCTGFIWFRIGKCCSGWNGSEPAGSIKCR